MKYILALCILLGASISVYATDVTVTATQIPNVLPSNIPADVTLTGVSVSNGVNLLTCSACFRPQWVGLGGFRVTVEGAAYTISYVTSTSSAVMTEIYAGSNNANATVVWYRYLELRIYSNIAFQPLGETYIVQPGTPGSSAWYKRVAVSLVNVTGTWTMYIPQIVLDSTTDSPGPSNQARYTAGFYRPDGSLVSYYACFQNFAVPATTPTTWTALCAYNSPAAIVPPTNEAYTKPQIDARFPSCTSGQMLYYAATGNAQACLTVGSGLTISSGTITASSSSNLRQALNAVLDYGAVGDGVTDDTTALQNCINASEAAGGKPCYIRAGTYLVTNLILEDNANLIGDGKTKTTIYSTTNSPLVTVSSTANNASIRRMGFKGTKAAGSSQVGLQFAGSSYYYNLIVEDVLVEETGSFGINITQPFSSTFRDIFIDDTAGFPLNYDAAVAPGNTFSQIYVGVTNTGAAVGFRIRSGDFVCIDCNGVNSSPTGGAWASVGTKNGVDGDTADAGARFTCIHCNLESFAAYGIISYSYSKINLLGNTTIAGGGAGTEIALYFDNTGDGATGCTPSPACEYYSQFIARGYIDDTVNISDGYAAYANSQPIHTAKGFPAIQVLGQGPSVAGGLMLSTYRNDTTGTVEKLSRADGKVSVQAISTTTTIANPGVKYIEADSTGGAITITIPWGGWYQEAQEPLIIKDVGGAAASNNITLNAGSGANIGSSTSLVMATNGQTVILMPSGSTGTGAWRILYDSSTSGGSATLTSTYVGYGSGANVLTGESAFTYDAANNILSFVKWSGAGLDLNTDVDNTIALLDGSFSIIKNNNNLRTFHGLYVNPVLNTGGSNLNTTVNVISVDTTNTAITGLTTNLLNLAYGGTTVFTVTSTGSMTLADGVRQTFNPNATNAGLNVGSVAGDPSAPSNGDLWYDSTANELTARINGSNVALGAGGSPTLTATYVGYGDGSNLLTGESAFTYDSTNNILSFVKWSGAGLDLDTDVNNTAALIDGSFSIIKNDSNLRTFHGIYVNPVLNTGGSNLQTTLNIISVDTTNTATTGLTTNLLNLAYNGTTVFTVTSTGAMTLADGVKQTFNPNATTAGINVGSVAGDPSAPTNGDLWYDSTANELTARINGANVALGSGGGGTISGTISSTQVAYGTGADTIGGEAAFTYDSTNNILSFVKWSGAGLDLDTDVNNTAALIDGSFSIIKNDSNLRTFHGIYVNPVLNTGGSNLQTTLNIISVDTTNTATTGLTTNLLNLAYNGTTVFTVTSTGSMTLADGVKQTFNPNATTAGINVGSVAGDPSSPANGDLWYDSTANELTARINGSNVALGAGGGGLTVGTTAIASGTAGRILYEASGNVLGEAAGITYQTGASPSVTITAQAASYVALQVNSAASPSADIAQFTINGSGGAGITSAGYLYVPVGSVSVPTIYFTGSTNTGITTRSAGNTINIILNGNNDVEFNKADAMRFAPAMGISWSNLSGRADGTQDTRIDRAAVSVIKFGASTSTGATFSAIANTPTQITADQNNYTAGGSGGYKSYFQRWSTDASRNITGLSLSQVDGQTHIIVNVGSNNIVLQHENASSTAANRFTCSTGADITLSANQAADIVYSSTTSRWLVFKRN